MRSPGRRAALRALRSPEPTSTECQAVETIDTRRARPGPNTFIVGAPKCGTTSLHRYLQEHPDVFLPRIKEPGYFAPDVPGTKQRQRFAYPADEARYLALFTPAGAVTRIAESSTNYLMSHGAPERIREFTTDPRIIVMVRNPVDLIQSLHHHRVSNGTEPIIDLAAALDADIDRIAGKRLPPGLRGYGVAYRDNAMLGEQLERWIDRFGRDRVAVIVFDDFVTDTPREFRRVLQFLDVDASFTPSSFTVHNARHVRRDGLIGAMVRNPGVRWLRDTALPSIMGESSTGRLAGRFSRRRLGRSSAPQVALDPDVRAQIQALFAADVAKLGTLLGRNLVDEWFGPEPRRPRAAA